MPATRAWHGPRIITVAFFSALTSTGFIFPVYSVLIGPMAATFGTSMAVMGLMPSIYHIMSAFISPLLGRHLGRLGIRRVMLSGACLLPLGLVAVAHADSVVEAGAWFAALAVLGVIAMGPLPAQTLITNWYGRSRGRAMGLASAGSTAAGVCVPPLTAYLIGVVGWREALTLMAMLGAVISLPMLFALAVDRPSDLAQQPEAESREDASGLHDSDPLAPPVTSAEILAQREFWLIAAIFGLLFAVSLVFMTYMVLYGLALGLTLQQAAWIMMARALSALGGQIGLARLSDRIGRREVLAIVIVAQAALWWLVVSPASLGTFVLAAIGLGFFGGVFVALRGSMVATIFGRENFSKVTGMMVPAAMPIQIAAVPIAGLIFDRTQEYSAAFAAYFFAFPLAALLLYFVRDGRGRGSVSATAEI